MPARNPTESRSILVWPFGCAPLELREIFQRCGDETWLALVPPELANEKIPWMRGDAFGPTVREQLLPDGHAVRVGSTR